MLQTENKHNLKKIELMRVAEKLFLEKGYEETSIDDILKASSLSKGGFYHYFKSKEEVLTESILLLMRNTREKLEPIVEDGKLAAVEKLKLFLERKRTLIEPEKELVKYLGMIMQSDFTLYKYYITLAQEYVEPLSKIIGQGTKEGVFKVKYPLETADILLRAVTTLPQSVYFSAYIQDELLHAQYAASLNDAICRILGMDSEVLIL